MVFENLANQLSQFNPLLAQEIQANPWILPLLIIQIVMKLIFYPIALYIAARRGRKAVFVTLFVAMFLLNEFAFLAIIYIILEKNNIIGRKFEDKKKLQKKKKKI